MKFKHKYIHKFYAFALAAVFALTLAGCGGGGGSATAPPDPPPVEMPTPYETALEAIAAAATPEAAQAAYDAVKGDITAAEGEKLQMAVDDRQAELAMMARAGEQKMNLMAAAGAIDTSDLTDAAAITAANTAIAALRAALAAAADVSDADKAMYEGQVTAAENAVAAAQSSLDHAAQTMVLTNAVEALRAIDLSGLSTQEAIDEAADAIAALQAALDNATELSATEKTAATIELMAANRAVASAQGRTDIEVQKMALSDAAATLGAIDLADLSTQEKIDAAEAAIIALDLALAAATGLTDAEKLDATVNVTVAKRRLADAKETLTANVDTQKTALADAAGMLDTSDLSTQEAIDAAKAAIVALRQAIANAVNVDTSMYQSTLDNAIADVDEAQGGIDTATRRTNQMAELSGASGTLQAALAALSGSTPTQAQLDAANAAVTALNAAIAAGADLTDAEKATYVREAANAAAPIQMAQAGFDKAKDADDEQMKKDMAAAGKALYAALSGNATAGTTALDNIDTAATPVSLGSAGLVIDAAAGAGSIADATNPDSVTLKAGDSAGALGSWMGTNYAHTNAGTKVMNAAVVYNNKGSAKTVTFAKAGYTVATETDSTNNTLKDYVFVVNAGAIVSGFSISDVMADAFTHSGTQNHSYNPDDDVAFTTRGTYDGAPGTYRCTGTCSSTNDGKGSPASLGGNWHFKPDAGAMVSQPDANYLYYGWWVSKDKDGMPTAASAFTGVVGAIAPLTDDPVSAVTGSATYTGGAAGKFALNNPADGTGDGGHFTADATLTAKFGTNTAPNNGGVSGTIENFMANGKSVPWSVTLNRAPWGALGAFTTPADDPATTNVDESKGTVWAIDGNKAAASGTWSGQMYDEMPGNAPDGDGSNVPTTVTGSFYSEFSTMGRMVGAFGANKQQ